MIKKKKIRMQYIQHRVALYLYELRCLKFRTYCNYNFNITREMRNRKGFESANVNGSIS